MMHAYTYAYVSSSSHRGAQTKDRRLVSVLSAAKDDNKGRLTPDNNDFISNIFARFLPKPEDVGLSRFDRESKPENFAATKTEWAALLASDKSDDMKLVRQVLAKTNLEYRPLALAYSATRDGWSAKKFHAKVDKCGPSVVLCRTKTGNGVFGGYNPCGWVNLGESRGSIAAFLFTFPGDNYDTKQRPIKLQKIAGASLAQVDDGGGPRFGAEGLTVPLDVNGEPRLVRSKLGLYYERLPNGKNSLLPNNVKEAELASCDVYVGVYQKGEPIPYSDAMFFQLN